MPEFTELENWPPNGKDQNPVDYLVWEHYNRWQILDIDQLKYVLIDCWAQLNQDIL